MRRLEAAAEWLADHTGSVLGVVLHTLWFGLWFPLAPHLVHNHVELLTNLVSLEAIYLSLLVLIQVRRQRERAEVAEEKREAEKRATLSALLASQKALLEIVRALRADIHDRLKPDQSIYDPTAERFVEKGRS